MLLVWMLGLMLAFNSMRGARPGFSAKLALVVALTALPGLARRLRQEACHRAAAAPARTLRIMNEIPGIAAAMIVVLVIVRPF